ncbi:MAG: 1-deoxy-D-xylulose-5-phosphate reductoisomerase [Porticoccaceae bacterium]|jgi:1-deoxy-D-xylulose-5-phosphate reductoisomerase|nr:MAG: 1-deoxy-D-xylulose 5-phosphate reductoisomerase [SAR92 bacterium BACL16 MAG-120619-bin48]KRP23830.1 MAG: 1-deoxy-D-xylulose 5-phosphate reductoisomerase [SAR92 bacterium BACL16 MAG-120322-bin99]MDP4654807.1 1-deoxy-D-xylulose-5-phosphate reductoisomerase [Alphaproteobacteria bacterium]MDP4745343.1 1-deoxy-D-xylulose-5-phosphate reductoisomerase [Porticoccaceae bacterium]MDP4751905.1 1-deoxy-D-xylulose-5-phosphate reductoisomerase [Porticoccaceae bacterium]
MQAITVLGATGSIGVSTLDVIARHPDKYSVFALTAHRQIEKLAGQCLQFKPTYAVVADDGAAVALQALLSAQGSATEVLFGREALCAVSSAEGVDTVMAAIVGAAGLEPTMAAVRAGKKILLANKEALVMAGGLFMQAVAASGSVLLPIDSEHNAIFQCLPSDFKNTDKGGVKKLLLSASGGPFRGRTLEQMRAVTPDQACAHPNWSMGRKISVDSATLMNKGLELIEACWLFNVAASQVEVVVHPQSIIHSLVQYIDGSVLAQLGNPDMRTPIAHALAWPSRIESGVADLDLFSIAQLNFEKPDLTSFPCLAVASAAAREGRDAAAILNGANEIAVQAFLDERIGFTQIAEVVSHTLNSLALTEPDSLEAVQESDRRGRAVSSDYITRVQR